MIEKKIEIKENFLNFDFLFLRIKLIHLHL